MELTPDPPENFPTTRRVHPGLPAPRGHHPCRPHHRVHTQSGERVHKALPSLTGVLTATSPDVTFSPLHFPAGDRRVGRDRRVVGLVLPGALLDLRGSGRWSQRTSSGPVLRRDIGQDLLLGLGSDLGVIEESVALN